MENENVPEISEDLHTRTDNETPRAADGIHNPSNPTGENGSGPATPRRRKDLKRCLSFALDIGRGLLFRLRTNRCGRRLRVHGPVIRRGIRATSLEIGDNVILEHQTGFYLDRVGAVIRIGDYTYINRRTEIMARERVTIGKRCAISWDVSIMDTDYHDHSGRPSTAPVTIGDNVWIGCRSIILKGAQIGAGAVIAAGSVVNRSVPARCLVAGAPARIIRENVSWG